VRLGKTAVIEAFSARTSSAKLLLNSPQPGPIPSSEPLTALPVPERPAHSDPKTIPNQAHSRPRCRRAKRLGRIAEAIKGLVFDKNQLRRRLLETRRSGSLPPVPAVPSWELLHPVLAVSPVPFKPVQTAAESARAASLSGLGFCYRVQTRHKPGRLHAPGRARTKPAPCHHQLQPGFAQPPGAGPSRLRPRPGRHSRTAGSRPFAPWRLRDRAAVPVVAHAKGFCSLGRRAAVGWDGSIIFCKQPQGTRRGLISL